MCYSQSISTVSLNVPSPTYVIEQQGLLHDLWNIGNHSNRIERDLSDDCRYSNEGIGYSRKSRGQLDFDLSFTTRLNDLLGVKQKRAIR